MVVPFRPDAAGGIKDPTANQILQPLLRHGIQLLTATQAMEIAIRVEAQLGRIAATAGQVTAPIAEGLEVTDGIGVLKGRHWCCGGLEDQIGPEGLVPVFFLVGGDIDGEEPLQRLLVPLQNSILRSF